MGGVMSLYSRATDLLPTKLQGFSSVQLIKVVLAIGHVHACRSLLEAAALEFVANRLADIPCAQLLLLTQGLIPLGGDHISLVKLMDHWSARFEESSKADTTLLEESGATAMWRCQDKLEANGQLTADQLEKLAQTLAFKAAAHERFWTALADRYIIGDGSLAQTLSSEGRASLEQTFSKGRGPVFHSKRALLRAVKTTRRERSSSSSS